MILCRCIYVGVVAVFFYYSFVSDLWLVDFCLIYYIGEILRDLVLVVVSLFNVKENVSRKLGLQVLSLKFLKCKPTMILIFVDQFNTSVSHTDMAMASSLNV